MSHFQLRQNVRVQPKLPIVTLQIRDENGKLLATVKDTRRQCVQNAKVHYSGAQYKWVWVS